MTKNRYLNDFECFVMLKTIISSRTWKVIDSLYKYITFYLDFPILTNFCIKSELETDPSSNHQITKNGAEFGRKVFSFVCDYATFW